VILKVILRGEVGFAGNPRITSDRAPTERKRSPTVGMKRPM
jgi:hypothetical protein